jgi:hypothetical protein
MRFYHACAKTITREFGADGSKLVGMKPRAFAKVGVAEWGRRKR